MRNGLCRMMGVGWMVVNWGNCAGRRSTLSQSGQPGELVVVTCSSSIPASKQRGPNLLTLIEKDFKRIQW